MCSFKYFREVTDAVSVSKHFFLKAVTGMLDGPDIGEKDVFKNASVMVLYPITN